MPSTAIYIVGPSSTGKTTLIRALAEHLRLSDEAIVTEVARDVMRSHGFTRKDVGKVEMQRAIMEAHVLREEELESSEYPILLFDRSAVDPLVYAILTAATVDDAQKKMNGLISSHAFQRALSRYLRNAIFILLGPVPEWLVDDGVRSIENQVECYALFKSTLKELGIPVYEIGQELKNLKDRIQRVLSIARL